MNKMLCETVTKMCFFRFEVAGFYSEWSDWSRCNLTCGGGSQGRSRDCTEPLYGGEACQGPPEEIQDCNTHECPGQFHNSFNNLILEYRALFYYERLKLFHKINHPIFGCPIFREIASNPTFVGTSTNKAIQLFKVSKILT